MKTSLWRRHVLPFILMLGLLAMATLAGDYVLHRLNLVWVGRYLGIPGTLLIVGSLVYSMRKRKYISTGDPKFLLKVHEFSAWLGSLLVLIHAGIHFNTLLPWLATVAMAVNVVSGLVGKYCWSARVVMFRANANIFSCVACPSPKLNKPCSGTP